MAKKPLLVMSALVLSVLAAAWAVYVLFPTSTAEEDFAAAEQTAQEAVAASSQPSLPISDSISTADLEDASFAEGVEEVDPPDTEILNAATLPSQLSKINVEGMVGVAPQPEEQDKPSSPQEEQMDAVLVEGMKSSSQVVLNLQPESEQNPQDQASSAAENEPTSITMLEAPVKTRLIKSVADYKAFKTIARGKYPEVDFNKQMLVVLESDSNLPDKVFEIQTIEEKDGKILVTYRVNIFGLENKLNTHSVQTVQQSALPIELKQVL